MTSFPRLRAMVVALLVPVLLTACVGGRGGSVPYEVKNFGQPDAPVAASADVEYRIGSLDQLGVIVYRVPDLSGDLQVLLQQQRRHGESVADIIESGGDSVRRKISIYRQFNREQVPNCIPVLQTIQAVNDGP